MHVILVDNNDQEIGIMEKQEAHVKARLHRAFSVFILNDKGEMLLHKRALSKYHSGGLWTNACCSHPQPGQETAVAASKRLLEEMGFTTSLEKVFDFVYQAPFDNGLTEHEFDHVYLGYYNGPVRPNPEEVGDYCYKSINAIQYSLETHPHKYTAWFKIAFPKIAGYLTAQPVMAGQMR